MALIQWTRDLEIGIPVIDGQHHRIITYINDLDEISAQGDASVTGRVIGDLIDYTYSHFAFEETLMEEAGYDAIAIHRNTHKAFCDRVDQIKARHDAGENVATELAELLQTWLISHIMSDDTSYAPLVKEKMPRIDQYKGGSWLANTLGKFFR